MYKKPRPAQSVLGIALETLAPIKTKRVKSEKKAKSRTEPLMDAGNKKNKKKHV